MALDKKNIPLLRLARYSAIQPSSSLPCHILDAPAILTKTHHCLPQCGHKPVPVPITLPPVFPSALLPPSYRIPDSPFPKAVRHGSRRSQTQQTASNKQSQCSREVCRPESSERSPTTTSAIPFVRDQRKVGRERSYEEPMQCTFPATVISVSMLTAAPVLPTIDASH